MTGESAGGLPLEQCLEIKKIRMIMIQIPSCSVSQNTSIRDTKKLVATQLPGPAMLA